MKEVCRNEGNDEGQMGVELEKWILESLVFVVNPQLQSNWAYHIVRGRNGRR